MSFQSEELLKHLPLEVQYKEIKAFEEAERQFKLSQARGRIFCFGVSLIMALRFSVKLRLSPFYILQQTNGLKPNFS